MRKKAREQKILKSLMNISGFMNMVETPDLILSLIIEECVLLTRAEWGMLMSFDGNFNIESFQVTKALTEEENRALLYRLEDKIEKCLYKADGMKALSDKYWDNKGITNSFKEAIGKGPADLLICPVRKMGKLLGIAVVVNKKGRGRFAKKESEDLSIICQEAAVIIENLQLFKTKLQNERMAAIGQTITGISHYIKNILQGISSGSYLLDSGIKKGNIKVIGEAWEVVSKNSKRISDLVLDMLYYSKERKVVKQEVDPKSLIGDVLGLLKPRLKEKNIKINASMANLPASVSVDEKGIHRSILNLLSNAVDACDKPDSLITLKVEYERPSQSLRIVVSDNGKGIPAREIDRLFQPFYSTKEGKGTGLGLAITKKVIDEHGGSITVSSEIGKGTIFEISFPTLNS